MHIHIPKAKLALPSLVLSLAAIVSAQQQSQLPTPKEGESITRLLEHQCGMQRGE
jgi:hypothetical protein